MSILDGIKNSSDIKKLNIKELKELCRELRSLIVSVTKENGGHLSSNLGIVETTVALHYVFDLPSDKLVFDVGHQCYAHKILSGRKDEFSTIRTAGGLSGFPVMKESEYDAFTAGHAGTSVSAGLGLCFSRDLKKQDNSVISLVGDGSFTNGLNLEALITAENKPKNFLLILNDNEMSISKNTNGFYNILSKSTAKIGYVKSKRAFKRVFGNSFITKIFRKLKNFIKRVINTNNYFEKFGFKYVGVIDGNDLLDMIKVLTRVKNLMKDRAVFLHVKTTKGKGHEQAETHADVYHGVGKDHATSNCDFSSALGETLVELIDKDKDIVAITAAMKDGTGLKVVEEKFPDNFIDVGIAEEYAVTLSAGIAAGGLKPVLAVYSTFMQRGYDQIIHDVCIANLPVVFCIDRAGFTGTDGETHQGLFDLSYLTHVPNIKIFAPSTVSEFKDTLKYALTLSCPVAIRYPNGSGYADRKTLPINSGLFEVIKKGEKANILAVGPRMNDLAIKVANDISGVGVINARTVKPLDTSVLDDIANTLIITLEENSLIGGFGAYVSAYYVKTGKTVDMLSMGAEDSFVKHGSVDYQMKLNGITTEKIHSVIKEKIREKQ